MGYYDQRSNNFQAETQSKVRTAHFSFLTITSNDSQNQAMEMKYLLIEIGNFTF